MNTKSKTAHCLKQLLNESKTIQNLQRISSCKETTLHSLNMNMVIQYTVVMLKLEALNKYWQEDKLNWHMYIKKTKLYI